MKFIVLLIVVILPYMCFAVDGACAANPLLTKIRTFAESIEADF